MNAKKTWGRSDEYALEGGRWVKKKRQLKEKEK